MPAPLPGTSGYTYAVELSADEALAGGRHEGDVRSAARVLRRELPRFPGGRHRPGRLLRSQGSAVDRERQRPRRACAGDRRRPRHPRCGRIGYCPPAPSSWRRLASPRASSSARRRCISRVRASGAFPSRTSRRTTRTGPSARRSSVANSPGGGAPGLTPGADSFANRPGGRPGQTRSAAGEVENPCLEGGSIIECQNQTLGETIAVAGTPFTLTYRSNRATGPAGSRTIRIPVTTQQVPDGLKRIDVDIAVAGQETRRSFAPGSWTRHHVRVGWTRSVRAGSDRRAGHRCRRHLRLSGGLLRSRGLSPELRDADRARPSSRIARVARSASSRSCPTPSTRAGAGRRRLPAGTSTSTIATIRSPRRSISAPASSGPQRRSATLSARSRAAARRRWTASTCTPTRHSSKPPLRSLAVAASGEVFVVDRRGILVKNARRPRASRHDVRRQPGRSAAGLGDRPRRRRLRSCAQPRGMPRKRSVFQHRDSLSPPDGHEQRARHGSDFPAVQPASVAHQRLGHVASGRGQWVLPHRSIDSARP